MPVLDFNPSAAIMSVSPRKVLYIFAILGWVPIETLIELHEAYLL